MANSDHAVLFEETKVLARPSHYYARLHREAIEIFKHSNNINRRGESLKVDRVWHSAPRTGTAEMERWTIAAV